MNIIYIAHFILTKMIISRQTFRLAKRSFHQELGWIG